MTRELGLALSMLAMWVFAVVARALGCPPEWAMDQLGTIITIGMATMMVWVILDHIATAAVNFWNRWISL